MQSSWLFSRASFPTHGETENPISWSLPHTSQIKELEELFDTNPVRIFIPTILLMDTRKEPFGSSFGLLFLDNDLTFHHAKGRLFLEFVK